jgi:hypothetical protein
METVERPEETFQRTERRTRSCWTCKDACMPTRSLAVEEQVSSLALIRFLVDPADTLRDAGMAVYVLVDSLREDRFCRNLLNPSIFTNWIFTLCPVMGVNYRGL